jgi:FkbM family methyltransferase
MLKNIINTVLQTVLPSKAYLSLVKWKRGFEEPELKLVYDFCDKDSISIDVGAANGMYIAHLYKISKRTIAFEPRKAALGNLQKVFAGITSNIQFEQVALSDFSGTTEMKILKSNDRLSTIEAENTIEKFGVVERVSVPVKKLDDYQFTDKVSFIKIDVEGHEESVLKGALNLIQSDHPYLLIEIEERHKKNSIEQIRNLLEQFGYKGYYYLNGHLNSIESFHIPAYHQYGKAGQPYIFNFVYIHQDAIKQVSHLLINP